jgi:hypothetical protein
LNFILEFEEIKDWNSDVFLQTIRFQSYVAFLKEMNYAPNSIANKCNSLVALLNYMNRSQEFEDKRNRIDSILHFLNGRRQVYLKKNKQRQINSESMEQLIEKGKFLTLEEIKTLFAKLLEFLQKFIDNNTDDDIDDTVSHEDAMNFQKHLITLSCFAMCGQRRQVTFNIHLENFKKVGDSWRIMLASEKVQRKEISGGIPIPNYLADLFNYYLKFIRPVLLPTNSKVLAFWINSNMELLTENKFTKYVNQIIRLYFPNKNITPINIRSNIPSLIFEHEISRDGESLTDFFNNFAISINTSSKIIQQHYNKAQATKRAQSMQNTLHTKLFNTESSEISQRKIQNSLQKRKRNSNSNNIESESENENEIEVENKGKDKSDEITNKSRDELIAIIERQNVENKKLKSEVGALKLQVTNAVPSNDAFVYIGVMKNKK